MVDFFASAKAGELRSDQTWLPLTPTPFQTWTKKQRPTLVALDKVACSTRDIFNPKKDKP